MEKTNSIVLTEEMANVFLVLTERARQYGLIQFSEMQAVLEAIQTVNNQKNKDNKDTKDENKQK